MKIIRHTIASAENIEIIPMADLHIGDPLSDWKLIKQRVDYIKSTPTAYALLDGDLMDNATTHSIGDTYGAVHNPMESVRLLVQLLEPIKGKILAACPGNHEQRTYRLDGIDITEMICSQLGILNVYSPTTCLIEIRLGKNTYRIYMTHGAGGGRKAGGKVNRLIDLAQITDADCYIMGHVHQPTATRQAIMVSDGKGHLKQEDKLFVLLAAALQYGGYADTQGYAPASTTNPTIYLSSGKKFCWAVV